MKNTADTNRLYQSMNILLFGHHSDSDCVVMWPTDVEIESQLYLT